MRLSRLLMGVGLAMAALGCGPEQAEPQTPGPEGLLRQIEGQNGVRSVRPWSFLGHDGAIIETTHYSIHTTLLDPLVATRLAGFMEASYQAYQQFLPTPAQPADRMTIYLLADRGQWESFTDTFVGSDAVIYKQIRKGAYCLRATCVAYPIGIEQTLSALGHEGWHQFTATHFAYRLPSWLDEGMATQYESFETRQGRIVFRSDRNSMRIGGLKLAIQRNGLIPLRALIELNPGQVIEDDNTIAAYYSQVYALIRFLQEASPLERKQQFQRMLRDGLAGDWPVDGPTREALTDRRDMMTERTNRELSRLLFVRYIPEDLDQLERAYETYCRRISETVTIKTQTWQKYQTR